MSPRPPRRPASARRRAAPAPAKAARAAREAGATAALREQARGVYRDAILEAAADVLTERGFGGTRMQDVASRAGLAIGTLYNYFPSKDQLTLSLMELRGRQFVARMERAHAELGPDDSVIATIIDVAFQHIEEHRALFSMFEEGELHASGGGGGHCAMRDLYKDAVRAALGTAQHRGEVRRDRSLEELEPLLGGMIRGVAHAWIAAGADGSLKQRAGLVHEVFLHGIAGPAARGAGQHGVARR